MTVDHEPAATATTSAPPRAAAAGRARRARGGETGINVVLARRPHRVVGPGGGAVRLGAGRRRPRPRARSSPSRGRCRRRRSGTTSARAWDKGVGDYLLNSIIVVTGGVLLTMLLGSMAAYVLARYEFWGNRFIYYLFAAGMMFPVFLAIVPLFFVVENLGMLSTYHGPDPGLRRLLAAVHGLLHARVLPDAAHRDRRGRGRWTAAPTPAVFFRVMLPMAKPGLLSIGIFNVLGQWNQFVLPAVPVAREAGARPGHRARCWPASATRVTGVRCSRRSPSRWCRSSSSTWSSTARSRPGSPAAR